MAKSKVINIPAASDDEAREAVRTLIRWAGDDPDRAGMADTPARVLQFYRDFFTGYDADVSRYTSGAVNDIAYDDFILVRNIRLASFCEHHMLPATGSAHIAYIPGQNVAGIGTLARIAADCARRFTTQEVITSDILTMMQDVFAPQGVAVSVSLNHGCMTLRDAAQQQAQVVTTKFSGIFHVNPDIQNRFLMYINAQQPDA